MDALLYVDIDTIFLSSPESIWNEFTKMNEKQLMAMVKESEISNSGYYYELSGVPFYGNTGPKLIFTF